MRSFRIGLRIGTLLPLLALLVALSAPAAGREVAGQAAAGTGVLAPGMYAQVRTSEGIFTFRLLENEAPKTVASFVGLAEGTLDPATGKPGQAKPFYDGLTFHRVVRGFLIQGGDPNGDGTGGPGYRTPDEKSPARSFTRAGLVAMVSHGYNKNGSQFFITLAPAPDLNGKATIFGEVVQGLDIVRKISSVKTQMLPNDRPAMPVRIDSVRIVRVTD